MTTQKQQQHTATKTGRAMAVSSSFVRSSTSHFAMIELKQKIIISLNKLGDRDTQQVAMEDLEKTIQNLTQEFVTPALNCLYDTDLQQKGTVRKESVRLIGTMVNTHPEWIFPHLPKIAAHLVRRLKDPDSSVRDACQCTFGVLSAQYLGGGEDSASLISVFLKPLFEALGEQNKSVQIGSAMCLSKIIENAKDPPPLSSFQKICPRICKYLANKNFFAKAQLITVIGSLSQVGVITKQQVGMVMPYINESLESTDWATRKATVDTLIRLATHSSHVLVDHKSSVVSTLENCRFDKVKPVRDSIAEALQHWKNIAGGEDDLVPDASKQLLLDKSESAETRESLQQATESSNPIGSKTNYPPNIPQDVLNKGPLMNTVDNKVSILKKKPPSLIDKGLNPEFFQKLENKKSNDWQIEVAIPKSCPPLQANQTDENSSDCAARSTHEMIVSRSPKGVPKSSSDVSQDKENLNLVGPHRIRSSMSGHDNRDGFAQGQWTDQRFLKNREVSIRTMESDGWGDHEPRDTSSTRTFNNSCFDPQTTNGRDNLSTIQWQLLQMERQQASIMGMLQDFIGSSQDRMIALENRVRSLERAVEDMGWDISFPCGRRGVGHMLGYEAQTNNRPFTNYLGANDFPSFKFGRGGNLSFPDRFSQGDVSSVPTREKDMRWHPSEMTSDIRDNFSRGTFRGSQLSENQMGARRSIAGSAHDNRFLRQHFEGEQAVNRRGWDKGGGPVRLGEGPSARSVWKAAKDEETLAAIRVAGEDTGTSRTSSKTSMLELDSEVSEYNNLAQGKGTCWNAWIRAMEALHSGDLDLAYSEVLFTGDEMLLGKLMNKSGPVLDQLSTGTVADVLYAISHLLQQQKFFDLGINWVQQVVDMIVDNSPDCLVLPLETKKKLLFSLHESSNMELPEDWEGNTVDEILMQLANAWSIELPQNRANG